VSAPARRLQKRLMLAFAGFTLVTAIVFGFYAIVFMYAIEDASFEAMLDQEAAYQLRQHAASGRWAEPREAWMAIHADPATFPEDLKRPFDAEPWRTEFAGREARHYHLRSIVPPAPMPRAWIVAEVGAQLVVRPMRNQVLLLLACTGVLIVTLALLLGWWIARRTSGPLSRLADRVDAMSPGQSSTPFAQDYPDDEVGVLARGLEGLAGRVQAFVVREQEFTRDASHELRTPLAVILGATERLLAEPGLSDAGRRHLGHVRQSVLQLEQTVATLLALAREQSITEGVAPVRVLPVLERVVVEQAPLLEGRRTAVEVGIDVPPAVSIALPEPVLHILLSNLVGNAFSHTVAGEVRIDIENRRLRISNSGDADDPASRWRQAQAFSKREGSGGLGLGLAIVRRLCERYRIDLRIEDAQGRVMASIPVDHGQAGTRHALRAGHASS
jgi:signal transduction histidine kinase